MAGGAGEEHWEEVVHGSCDVDACEFFPALPAEIGDDDGPTSRRSRRSPQRRSRLSGKDVGSTTMGPLFILTERFDPRCGERWHKYVAWSKLHQLTEVVSLDDLLCPHVVRELLTEDWRHIVNESYMLHFFTDVEYLVHRCGGIAGRNLLCAFRDPQQHPSSPPAPYDFRVEGYDLADADGSTSALTNCGGFPLAFSNDELTSHGLLPSLWKG